MSAEGRTPTDAVIGTARAIAQTGYHGVMPHPRTAFTLIELLVVIAIIALLIGILLPALGSARQQGRIAVGGSRLQQLGLGIQMYMNDYDEMLPQYMVPGFDGELAVIGALFGGKKGQLPFLGIDEVGAERRPLNAYVVDMDVPPDDAETNVELEPFDSPMDKGAENIPFPGYERTDSFYDLLGASYTLNDHALDTNPYGDDYPTLVPRGGGRMPQVLDTTKTWVLADHPIYNYDDGGDRESFWYDARQADATLGFLDGHVTMRIGVPEGQVQTTPDYTYLPQPNWLDRFD
jgi:prepilin-type N-terminal cleavage/methylation domain-containing protein